MDWQPVSNIDTDDEVLFGAWLDGNWVFDRGRRYVPPWGEVTFAWPWAFLPTHWMRIEPPIGTSETQSIESPDQDPDEQS